MPTATLTRVQRLQPDGVLHITLDIGDEQYAEMDHIKILTPNPDHEVEIALNALQLSPDQAFDWHYQPAKIFLSRYANLDHSFKRLDWYPDFTSLSQGQQTQLKTPKALTVPSTPPYRTPNRSHLQGHGQHSPTPLLRRLPPFLHNNNPPNLNFHPRRTRTRRPPPSTQQQQITSSKPTTHLDLIVKVNPYGRFPSTFLLSGPLGAQMRFSLATPDTWTQIQTQKPTAPFIAICTGSGIGPVRALLLRRIADLHHTSHEAGRPRSAKMTNVSIGTGVSTGSIYSNSRRGSISSIGSGGNGNGGASGAGMTNTHRQKKAINHHAHLGVRSTLSSVSLFAGFKACDAELIHSITRPATQAGITDVVELCPGNERKVRVQDH